MRASPRASAGSPTAIGDRMPNAAERLSTIQFVCLTQLALFLSIPLLCLNPSSRRDLAALLVRDPGEVGADEERRRDRRVLVLPGPVDEESPTAPVEVRSHLAEHEMMVGPGSVLKVVVEVEVDTTPAERGRLGPDKRRRAVVHYLSPQARQSARQAVQGSPKA